MLFGRMISISGLSTFLPPTKTWILLLVCISPAFSASVWQSHSRGSDSNDVVKLDHGPKFSIPDAIGQIWGGRTTEQDVPVGIQQYPAKLDLNQGFEQPDVGGSSTEWETVLDPRFYIITELGNSGNSVSQGIRRRRNANPSPSLSIVNPLDVLRQRLLFEIARRRQIQSHSQIMANNELLRNIGRK